jgi:hypothetical protein
MPLQPCVEPYKPRPKDVADIERRLGMQEGAIARCIPQTDPMPIFTFVGGSLADGFGNATSDIDLYAIFDVDPPPATEDCFKSSDGIAVQYATIPLVRIEGMIARLNGYAGRAGDLDPARLNNAHRFASGIPVTGAEKMLECRRRLDTGRFRSLCAEFFEFYADNNLVDAEGAAADGNFDAMLVGARSAVGHALDSLLADLGETTVNEKWRYDKAKRALLPFAKPLVEACFAAETNIPTGDERSKRGYLEHCWRLVSRVADLQLWAQVGLDLMRAPHWLLLPPASEAGYSRAPRVRLRRSTMAKALIVMFEGFEVASELIPAGAALWSSLPGASNVEQVVCRATTLLNLLLPTAKLSLPRDRVQSLIDGWRAKTWLSTDVCSEELPA